MRLANVVFPVSVLPDQKLNMAWSSVRVIKDVRFLVSSSRMGSKAIRSLKYGRASFSIVRAKLTLMGAVAEAEAVDEAAGAAGFTGAPTCPASL
ncbi:hypothetical protein D3C87_1375660 [compost metagenome]